MLRLLLMEVNFIRQWESSGKAHVPGIGHYIVHPFIFLEESESEGWEWNGHEPNERMMHVFNMVDSPVGSERQGHAKGMHGPLLLKQSKIDG